MQGQIEALVNFYQLDLEMSFVEQEDVFNVVEGLMINLLKNLQQIKLSMKNFQEFHIMNQC